MTDLLWVFLAMAFINGGSTAPSSVVHFKIPETGETVNNLPDRIKRSEEACEPGSRFQLECNTCLCSADGTQMACTKRVCSGEPVRTKREDQACEPNLVFKESCNTCRCSADGSKKVCTRMFCTENTTSVQDKQPSNDSLVRSERQAQACEPGSVFKKSCNTCRCNENGTHAICTLMFCSENILETH